jgi:hypothetical protein
MSTAGQALSPEARELYESLKTNLVETGARWKTYKELFVGNDARLELLRESANVFFGRIQRVLLDDVILGIARLADRAKQRDDENQSAARLLEVLANTSDKDLVARLEGELARVQEVCAPFMKHRNKRVAHRDKKTEVRQGTTLPELSVQSFELALFRLSSFLNQVEEYFGDLAVLGHTQLIEPYLESVDGLIWCLKKAAALDLAVKQMEQGNLVQRTKYASS